MYLERKMKKWRKRESTKMLVKRDPARVLFVCLNLTYGRWVSTC